MEHIEIIFKLLIFVVQIVLFVLSISSCKHKRNRKVRSTYVIQNLSDYSESKPIGF